MEVMESNNIFLFNDVLGKK